jgi:uncharacterized caspase-like protein
MILFSGHGWREATPGGDTFLVPQDVRLDRLGMTALRATDFAAGVASVAARRLVVILDCCHAGGMAVKGLLPDVGEVVAAAPAVNLFLGRPSDEDGPKEAPTLDPLDRGSGRAVLSSCAGDQLSYVRADGTMSVFTYHLIEALTGHAAPTPEAQEVLVSDVMSYVTRRVPETVRRQSGAEQTPDFRIVGNFPLALLLGGKGLAAESAAPDPLADLERLAAGSLTVVNTGGGAYVGGNVSTDGGDFTGRDSRRGGA